MDIKISGTDTLEGFQLKFREADGRPTNHNPWDTATNAMRGRSKMLADAGYLFLDSDVYGKIDERKLM